MTGDHADSLRLPAPAVPPIAFRAAILILPATSPRRLMTNIESPCNKVCTVDPISGLCVGCGRNLAEIEGWIRFTADERAGIMAKLPQRLAALGRLLAERAGPG
jgi:predicted Fe-S protein YdhL (DUF1289 family)